MVKHLEDELVTHWRRYISILIVLTRPNRFQTLDILLCGAFIVHFFMHLMGHPPYRGYLLF